MAESIPFYSDGVLEIALWRNVVFADVSGDLTMARTRTLWSAYRRLIGEYPGGVVGFGTIRAGVPIASSEARAENARCIKELGSSILMLAMMIEDNGIFAQAMRTIIRGLNVLSRGSKLVVFSKVDDAIRAVLPLIASREGHGDLAAEFRDAVTAHRGVATRASVPALKHAR